ncbi:MAG TPA: hypothetical protein V6C81_17915 [Planktothrix sp.]|jgi:hypothetical protein
MTFPDPIALKDSLSDLKDIVSRSQGDNNECVRLLGQMEALVSEIERKTVTSYNSAQSVAPVVIATTPIVSAPISL